MNPLIHLDSNSWYKSNNVYATGFIIDDSGIYTKEKLCDRVLEFANNPDQIISGEFAVIIIEEKQVRLISDAIRSKPLFYKVKEDLLKEALNLYN